MSVDNGWSIAAFSMRAASSFVGMLSSSMRSPGDAEGAASCSGSGPYGWWVGLERRLLVPAARLSAVRGRCGVVARSARVRRSLGLLCAALILVRQPRDADLRERDS